MPGNLQDMPMSVIATWPTPNYVDPVRRPWMPAYAITWQVACAILVGARYWLRITKKAGGLGLDDVFLLPGFLFGILFTVLCYVLTSHYGADRHIWDTPPDEYQTLAFGAWLAEAAFLLSTSCTKISVLLFYRRLTAGTFGKRWKWAVWAALAFTVCYCLGFFFALGFNCRPIQAYWKAFNPLYTKNYTCTNTKVLNPLSGVFSVVSDLYAVVLPMAMMRHFEMDGRKKLALNIVFSLSLLVVGAGIARTYYFTELGYAYDITWVAFDVMIWSIPEIQIALMCACAPVLRILIREYLKEPVTRAFNTVNRSGGRSRAESRMSNPNGNWGKVSFTVSNKHSNHDSQDWEGTGDKKLIRHSIKPSLETVEEGGSSRVTSGVYAGQEKMFVKVESYAMSRVDRKDRPLPPLPNENPDMTSTLSEPFSSIDWYETDVEKQEVYELPGKRLEHELPTTKEEMG